MRRRPSVAAALDVLAVLLFVAIGRRSHDEDGSAVGGVLSVAAPLLIGLAVGWLVARAWTAPVAARTGVLVWLVTVVIGLAVRRLVFDRGIAMAFVIVTTVVLGLLIVGWRLAFGVLEQRRTPRPAERTRP